MQQNKMGTLYVVATPIGNLQDITLRAIEVLKEVDRVVAEDTRHSGSLLKHFSIHKPILSLHEFNERERYQTVIRYLQQGESLALISDAGTPLISDPGFRLVNEAKALGILVKCVPGACAAIAALSVSGLATDQFIFDGFLPAKEEARLQRLTALAQETGTLIFYEAPHRLMACLQSMLASLGKERKVVVARELTKTYESVLSDTLPLLLHHFETHPEQQRGEIVILVEGAKEETHQTTLLDSERVLDVLLEELPLKQAAALASKITGERKNVLYERALAKKEKK